MSILQKSLSSLLSLCQNFSQSVKIWQSSDKKISLHSFFLSHGVCCQYVQLWWRCEELPDGGFPYGTSASGYSGCPRVAALNRSMGHQQIDLHARDHPVQFSRNINVKRSQFTADVYSSWSISIHATSKGVGTAGATGALAPAMLKPRRRKCLLAPAIICQLHLLVDSQTCISVYSFIKNP